MLTTGDFHPGNMLVGGSKKWDSSDEAATLELKKTGVLACDFENSANGPAIVDLVCICSVPNLLRMTGDPAAKIRDAVCRGYLQGSNLPAEAEDVFALALDVERCRLRFMPPHAAKLPGTFPGDFLVNVCDIPYE